MYTLTCGNTRSRDNKYRVTTMADGLILSTRANARRPSSTCGQFSSVPEGR